MRVGIAADHGGLVQLNIKLQNCGAEIVDYSTYNLSSGEDYPDFIVPSAQHISRRKVKREIVSSATA
jgi:ribose 5-phosphate isomerase RpiB